MDKFGNGELEKIRAYVTDQRCCEKSCHHLSESVFSPDMLICVTAAHNYYCFAPNVNIYLVYKEEATLKHEKILSLMQWGLDQDKIDNIQVKKTADGYEISFRHTIANTYDRKEKIKTIPVKIKQYVKII